MKKCIVIIALLALCAVLTACGSSSSGSYRSSSSSSSNGYGMPKKGDTFSDYVKREAPELYSDMQKQYNAATGK